ncbi:MFS transporter [Thermococcus sp. M39]|uniref:MFS transporter n=1 Tax=unclassified Thermococcus TaxID=2627626 RepID=UPI00143B3BF7|nr:MULTISPECIES: MFS transporter [unclassified Thermococcus]NJE07854.1 MFS transporter [Thermococcus sp. M39]NJE13435.1 MFS transporter [Thermococcus sp. LS2]
MKREKTVIQALRERVGKFNTKRKKRRNIVLFAIGMFFANVSWGIAFPYLSVYMRIIGGTMLFVGLLSVVFNMTSTVFQYPFGYLSDKTRKRKPFIAFGVFSSGLIYVFMALVSSPILLLTLRTLQGALTSAMMPAHSALISELSTKVGSAFGFFSSVENAGYMLGNFLGSFIVEYFGIKGAFFAAFLFATLGTLFVLMISEKQRPKKRDFGIIAVQEARESDRVAFEGAAFKRLMHGNLRIFYISMLLIMIASGEVYSVLSVYFGELFGERWVGILFGIDSLAAAASAVFIGKLIDRYGAKLFYVLSIIGYMAVFVGYTFATSLKLMVVVCILSGVKWSMTLSSASTYVALKVKASEKAQAMGLLNTMMSLGWVIGPMLGGYLAGISFRFMFLSTLVPLGIALLLMFMISDKE